MPKTLDIRLAGIAYTATFERPAFKYWGKGGDLVAALYEAMSSYNITLANIIVSGHLANSSESLITVRMPDENSTLKFAFNRLDFSLNGLTTESIRQVPSIFRDGTSWLRKDSAFKFSKHSFAYYSHAFVSKMTRDEVLGSINPRKLRSAGESLGTGAVFHSFVPKKGWRTRLTFEHSVPIQGAVFIGLFIELEKDVVDYDEMFREAREYYREILAELDLELPEGE
jgi:hypothetical protein